MFIRRVEEEREMEDKFQRIYHNIKQQRQRLSNFLEKNESDGPFPMTRRRGN